MIPAKITNLNPVEATYESPSPEEKHYSYGGAFKHAMDNYEPSKVIAEVENVKEYTFQNGIDLEFYVVFDDKTMAVLELNQPVFIELSGEGKCKIIKL